MILSAVVLALVIQVCFGQQTESYYGTPIGRLTQNFHGVSGDVYAVDDTTIFIKSFNYDGTGPDAYFWSGTSDKPDEDGFIIPDEKGSTKPLEAYSNKDLVLRLPEGKTLKDIKYLSVWCRKFKANFGDLIIPKNLAIPSPVEVPSLSQLAHGVKSGPITIVDAQTFLVPNFHYDGEGPAGYWWVTRGTRQAPTGLRLKDENGSPQPLRRYAGETVVISLPDDKTIYDFDWFGVWCEEFNVDFGHVRIPQHIRVPPSPKMLGIKPENKLNCEVLYDDLGYELRWVMDGDDIVMQLVGKVEPNDYMAFGLSKDDSKTDMINADAIVAWVKPNGQGQAIDYYLGNKEQCVGSRGSCPDVKHQGASDSITMLHSAIVNGYSMVTFKRPQLGIDEKYDQHVYSDGPQAVMWSIGPLNQKQEVSYHRLHNHGDLFIDFARTPKWNCPTPDPKAKPQRHGSLAQSSQLQSRPSQPAPPIQPPIKPQSASTKQELQLTPSASSKAWTIPPIVCPVDTTFRAQIGPTGGQKGYQSITGKVGWGIAWYINGLLIPEMVLQRGKTYTFIVEGGNDAQNSARRHPLYLTDSPDGGFEYKPDEERKDERIFAGVGIRSDGVIVPLAEGRLCEWKIDPTKKEKPEHFNNFFEFQRTLNLECQPGISGVLRFTPDHTTPDIIYYHCYTHRNLGWKIRIVDNCDQLSGQASIRQIVFADPGSKINNTKKHDKEHREIYHNIDLQRKTKPNVHYQQKNRNVINQGARNRISPIPRPLNTIIPAPIIPIAPKQYHGPPPYLFGVQPAPMIPVFPKGPVIPSDILRAKKPNKKPNQVHQQQHQALPSQHQVSFANNLHGGFVPMLIRNETTLKVVTTKSPKIHHQININQMNYGITNPFNSNSSVPFHQTFKPPNLDYSGFNISRYGDLRPGASGTLHRPVQLKKPIVPLPNVNHEASEKVNIPMNTRYKLKQQQNDNNNKPNSSSSFHIPESLLHADENSVPSEDVIHEYIDEDDENTADLLTSLRIALRPQQEDHMIAVERGGHQSESQKEISIINPNAQVNDVKEKYFGQRISRPDGPTSSGPTSTADHLIEVVDESPLKTEVSSSKSIITSWKLSKEELKNRTDHAILNDVLRLIAQNPPILSPEHTHVEIHVEKRSSDHH